MINRLREAYKTVYRRGPTLDQAITEPDQNNAGCAEVDAFLEQSEIFTATSFVNADLCGSRRSFR